MLIEPKCSLLFKKRNSALIKQFLIAHTHVSYYSMKRDSLTKFASCVNNIFHSALIISFVGDDFDSKLIFPVVTVLRKYTFRLNIYKNLKFEAILIPTLHRNDLIKPLSF
jgi:hypothetical protein